MHLHLFTRRNVPTATLAIFLLLSIILGACSNSDMSVAEPPNQEEDFIRLATTTSTDNSGLLDYILPSFEEEHNIRVDVIAVGTGKALRLGEDGNADVVLVHARGLEDEFMVNKYGTRREDVMYNDFVIVGPENDPADIGSATSAAEALSMISTSGTSFVSRGDESGTHVKELSIWEQSSINPKGDWYVAAGQGMGAVLTMAEEMQAYSLTDRATYLARTLGGIKLNILFEGDPILFNPYGVMAVSPDLGAIRTEAAENFINWIISVPTQELIGSFGIEEFDTPLFIPDSRLIKTDQ